MKSKLCFVLITAGSLIGGSAGATYSDNFDSYAPGGLNGNGIWSADVAYDVIADGTAPSLPNSVRVVDNDASGKDATIVPPEPVIGDGRFIWYGKHDANNNLSDTSGFSAMLHATLDTLGTGADRFIVAGFSSGDSAFTWTTFGSNGNIADSSSTGTAAVDTWYKFDMDYLIDAGDNWNKTVQLTISPASGGPAIVSEPLFIPNNQGGRAHMTFVRFSTGSTHQNSTFYLDSVENAPEPASLVLLGLGAAILLRFRRG